MQRLLWAGVWASAVALVACNGSGTQHDTNGRLTGHIALRGASSNGGASITVSSAAATATSADDGSFAIESLTPSHYKVHAAKDGYVPADAEVDVAAGKTATVEFTLDRLGVVTGTVQLAGVTHYQGTTIAITGDGTASGVTDAQGYFSIGGLAPGNYSLAARHAGWLEKGASFAAAMNESKTVDLSLDVVDPTKGEWRDGFLLPGAAGPLNGRVQVMQKGPDGRLYAGGDFTTIGGVPASHIAAWDGTTWSAIGAGLPGTVSTLTFAADGTLYAAGTLGACGPIGCEPNRVAFWNGTTWDYLPGAFQGTFFGAPAPVHGLAFQGDTLLVAGEFPQIQDPNFNNIDVGGIARFDFSTQTYSAVGTGGADSSTVTVLTVEGSTACIGGIFAAVGGVAASNIACWDGTAWSQLGDGLPGQVMVLVRNLANQWVAGGTLTYGDPTGDYRAGLAVLNDGTWAPLAGGVDGGEVNTVRTITFDTDGSMLIGGDFKQVGKGTPQVTAASAIARLKGTTWSEVGGGIVERITLWGAGFVGPYALVVDGGSLYIGGAFSHSGGVTTVNLARFDGTAFHALDSANVRTDGVAGHVEAMIADEAGNLVLGGTFTQTGPIAALNVARRSASGTWEAMGAGFDSDVITLLRRRDGTIVAGGWFQHSGATSTPFLASFNGTAWSSFTPAVNGPVRALFEDASGDLIIGGDFTRAGTLAANHIVRWDGTQFQKLGDGLGGIDEARVDALALDASGNLVAGGFFTKSGTTPMVAVARWNGTAWEPLGGSVTQDAAYVTSLALTQDGELLVGGFFNSIGGKEIVNLARWNGETYLPTTLGAEEPSSINAILPFGAGYFVNLNAHELGELTINTLAWFDGTSYHGLGHDSGVGLSDLVTAMVAVGDTLYFGGPFTSAGGQTSFGLAAWTITSQAEVTTTGDVGGTGVR